MKKLHFNPILKKDLQMSSRSIKFTISLMCYSIALTLISAIMLICLTNLFNLFGSRGVSYDAFPGCFMALAFIQLAVICIIVPILTAGTIAGERERQTLDIMLTTPIRPVSIVIGKLETALYKILMFAIASLPAMSICFIYGGISWWNLLIFLIQLMILAFFVGAVGVWCSCVFRKTIVAVIMTMVVEYAFLLGPFIIIGLVAFISAIVELFVTSGVSADPQIGPVAFLVLLDPIFGAVDTIVASNTGYNLASVMVMDEFGGSFAQLPWVEFFVNLWPLFSSLCTIGLGVFFVWAAARSIDSIRRKGTKRRKR